jgi:5-methylthioadenosine/S-adenosylhomocysteine deaminase
MTPLYDIYSTLVYAATAQNVRTTIIQGRIVMEDRVIKTVDVAMVQNHMRELSHKISAAVGQ